jgi:HEAT repeat protein
VVGRYRDELTADDPTVRADAVRELATAVESDSTPEQAVVDAIAERLDDDDAAVRSAACEALGSLGASRAKPYLRDRRIDPDPEVSRAASRALRNLE